MIAVQINEASAEGFISFSSALNGPFEITSHIKPELVAFEKTTHGLGLNNVVCAIQYSLTMIKNLVLCHLEMSNAKIDQKYEIRTKK